VERDRVKNLFIINGNFYSVINCDELKYDLFDVVLYTHAFDPPEDVNERIR
jgi:hypothetical protein